MWIEAIGMAVMLVAIILVLYPREKNSSPPTPHTRPDPTTMTPTDRVCITKKGQEAIRSSKYDID